MVRLQSPWGRYGLAAAGTLAVSLIYVLSHALGVSSDLRYFSFTLVALVSAILGGLGPSLLATGLASFTCAYLLFPPMFSLHIASEERTALLILFAGEGILLSLIGVSRDARDAEVPISWPERYLVAALFVSAATGLKFLVLRGADQELPFTFFYAAIAGSAWRGGFSAGVAATLFSSLSARYFFLVPMYSLSVSSRTNATRATFFILEGIVIAYLSAKRGEARRVANEALRRLHHLTGQLKASTGDARALRSICGDIIWELNLASKPTMARATDFEHPEPAATAVDFTGWLQQVHPKDRLNAMASLRSALEQGRTEWFYEYRRRRPGRGYVHVSDHAYIIRDEAWNPVRVVARSADSAEQRRTSLTSTDEGPYRAFFENNPAAILLADKGLRIIEANDAVCDLLGYRSAELKKLDVENVFEARRRGLVMDMLLALDPEDQTSITFEEECMRADGEVFRAKISAAMISELAGSSVDRMITIEEIADIEQILNRPRP